MWERIGEECGWKRLRAPSVRKIFDKRTTVAVLDFSRDIRVGCTSSLAPLAEEEEEGEINEGEEGVQA